MFSIYKFPYKILKRTFFLIIIYLFVKSESETFKEITDCTYPHHYYLNNGNNLLWCQQGIYIYDSKFEAPLNNYDFVSEEQISSLDDATLTTFGQFETSEGGNFIFLTKNKFYFFQLDGTLIFKYDFNINNSGSVYTLVPYKANSQYNFIVAFLNTNIKFNLQYYKINQNEEKIDLLGDYEPSWDNKKYYSVGFYYGFDCKIMGIQNLLTCFYYDTNIGANCAISFDIENDFAIDESHKTSFTNSKPKYFKVELSQNKSIALNCYRNMENQKASCLNYDINNNSFYNVEYYFTGCEGNPYNIQLKYISKTKEYIFSCLCQDGNIRMIKFDNNMNIIQNENLEEHMVLNYEFKGYTCKQIYYNTIYLPQYNNYIFLSDASCENSENAGFYLLPEAFNPTAIEEEESTNSKSSTLLTSLIYTRTTHLKTTLIYKSSTSYITTSTSLISNSKIPNYTSILSTYNSISTSFNKFTSNTILKSSISLISHSKVSSVSIPLSNNLFTSIYKHSPIIKSSFLSTFLTESTFIIKTTLLTKKNLINKSTLIIKSTLINTSIIINKSTLITKTTLITKLTSITESTLKIKSTLISNIFSSPTSNHILSSLPQSYSSSIYSNQKSLISTIIPSSISFKILSTFMSSSLYNPESNSLSTKLSNYQSTIILSSSPISTLISSRSYIKDTSSILQSSLISTFSSIIKSTIKETETDNISKDNNITQSCSFEYFYKNIISNECEKYCSFNEFINEICYINNLTENNIMDITDNIGNLIKKLEPNENTNIIINGENALLQVVSSDAMGENKDKNITIIDFGLCEEIIKLKYGLDYILILQLDILLTNSTNIVMKYEVYNPINLEKINLSICNNINIDIYKPYLMSEEDLNLYKELNSLGYNLLDPNDSFYHDICTPYTTKDKTDALLYNRRNNLYKNITVCEEGCQLTQYDYIGKYAKCKCIIKDKIDNNINNVRFYGNILIATFFHLSKFSNLKILKCFNLVFSEIGQNKNIGSYIFIVNIFIYIILMIKFCFNFKSNILGIFNNIIEKKYFKKKIASPIKKRNNKSKKFSHKLDKTPIIINKNVIINNNNYFDNKEKISKRKFQKSKTKVEKSNNLLNIHDSSRDKIKLKSLKFTNKIIRKNKIENVYKIKKINGYTYEYRFNNDELNSLPYKDAIIYDKRTYFQYYYSLLKHKHLIFFTFFSNEDYNIFSIKLSLFIFSFCLFLTINALFFDDITMNKIYKSKGNFFNILHTVYSTLISTFITLIIKLLALSNSDMLKIKKIKSKRKALMEGVKLIKVLNIKFSIYYIISSIFLILFWYFISAFCAVYKNTQILLIKNTAISYLMSLLYPLGLNLIPGIFRITALRDKLKNKECIYVFANILSIF